MVCDTVIVLSPVGVRGSIIVATAICKTYYQRHTMDLSPFQLELESSLNSLRLNA